MRVVAVIVIALALGFGGGYWTARAAADPPAPAPSPAPQTAQAGGHEEMDAAHEARVKAFPAKTAGLGGQPLRPKIVGGVKVFELTAQAVQWEVEPGVLRPGFAYNAQIPGPILRATEGDRVRVILRNSLPESTSIHFHGLLTPNAMDGVPFITQPPVRPGQTFTYEFVATPSGSHMYHSHNGDDQITRGLFGAFIVDPKRPTGPRADLDVVLVVNDGPLGYTLNGKSFPATQPIVAARGQRMHLHGLPQRVIAKDGHLLAQPYSVDTVNVAPGERYDIIAVASQPGIWALHCHILSHAESKRGMHGMVTAVIVK
jgi:FtsP/CotA-like multicopper oxidase with cupredoxin domain